MTPAGKNAGAERTEAARVAVHQARALRMLAAVLECTGQALPEIAGADPSRWAHRQIIRLVRNAKKE